MIAPVRTAGLAITMTLGLLLYGDPRAAVEAQEPSGYWLYVEGAWKGGFVRGADCEAAAAGRPHECRPMYGPPGTGGWTRGDTPREQIETMDKGWANAVQFCIGAGRASDRFFDAHVSVPGVVEMVGTSRGRFAFGKCMTDQGHPLQPSR